MRGRERLADEGERGFASVARAVVARPRAERAAPVARPLLTAGAVPAPRLRHGERDEHERRERRHDREEEPVTAAPVHVDERGGEQRAELGPAVAEDADADGSVPAAGAQLCRRALRKAEPPSRELRRACDRLSVADKDDPYP